KGISIDEEGFQAAMKVQRETARAARGVTNYMGADVTVYESIDPSVTSTFVGYDTLTHASKVTVLTTETEITDALTEGVEGTIFVEETPFYATSGGQNADKGTIVSEDGSFSFEVKDVKKLLGGKIAHIGCVTKGMVKTGDTVKLQVEEENRLLSGRNHSATHLLQKALRTVLRTHVEQAGSYVDASRLRFDFTHFSALSQEELKEVEEIVNKAIADALPVKVEN